MTRITKKKSLKKSCIFLFRSHLGWTQKKLAESVGTSARMVCFFESKHSVPPPRVIQKILKIAQNNKYQLTYDDFVGDYDMD
jgi:transcriptional regulator with XRE-family HTH domain